jgi:hypothetical protein
LQQEIIELEAQKLELEKQMLGLVEQRKVLKQEN